MAVYATEAAVRERFQLTDTEKAPADFIAVCIGDAHEELLRELDFSYDVEPPADLLAAGEALLAGARVFRGLAAQDAVRQANLRLGSQEVSAGGRFEALIRVAREAEDEAWRLLGPFLAPKRGRGNAAATDTQAILGEEA